MYHPECCPAWMNERMIVVRAQHHCGWDEEQDQIKVTPPLPLGESDEGVDI